MPIHAEISTINAIDHVHDRRACRRERTPYLEDEEWIGEPLGIERERSGQLSRRIKIIDTGGERLSTQINTCLVAGGRQSVQNVERVEGIRLSLLRNRVSLVNRSGKADAPLAGDRGAWPQTEITLNGGRTGIGHRRGAQHRKTLRRTKWYSSRERRCGDRSANEGGKHRGCRFGCLEI